MLRGQELNLVCEIMSLTCYRTLPRAYYVYSGILAEMAEMEEDKKGLDLSDGVDRPSERESQ